MESLPQPFRFTKENARENAAKSWQARRERKGRLEAEAAKGRLSTPQSERLALHIKRIEQFMEKTTDANELQKLSAAHARLFRAWQVLTETPNPGSRRVKGRPSRQPMPTVIPVSDVTPLQTAESNGNAKYQPTNLTYE